MIREGESGGSAGASPSQSLALPKPRPPKASPSQSLAVRILHLRFIDRIDSLLSLPCIVAQSGQIDQVIEIVGDPS